MAIRQRERQENEALYYNSGTSETPVWERIGVGVSSATESANAQTEDVQDIDQNVGETVMVSLRPAYAYSMNRVVGDSFNDFIADIHFDQLVGQSCEILTVAHYAGATSPYKARRATFTVVQDAGASGEAGSMLVLSGNLNQAGQATLGTATYATSADAPVFTESAS